MRMSVRFKMWCAALIGLVFCGAASAQYVRTDLVTNSGAGGAVPDPNLVNAWGLTALPGTPFWVSDNATGKSTLYTGTGQLIPLVVTVPGLNGAQGTPTGIVGNPVPTDFIVTENGKSGHAFFIFATLDGTIRGWNPGVGGLSATLAANRSDVGAVYTGLAIGSNGGQNFLFAADDGPNRRIDVFNATFQLQDLGFEAFADPKIPKDFAPYGIQTITNSDGSETVWVTYTALDKAQGGFVDSFTTAGVLINHFAVHGPLHSPWGIAKAPADFGPMSNALLVSNNISRGRIDAFDSKTGAFLGPLRDVNGNPIEIDGLWAIQFGQDGGPNGRHNQLFFTAGPSNYFSGTFGVIRVGP